MHQYDSLEVDHAVKRAEEADCRIEYADDYTLQLDIDDHQAFRRFESLFKRLLELGEFDIEESYNVRWSRHGNHHITIFLNTPISADQRIALQSILGSDPKREMLSLARIRKGQDNAIKLFRPRKSLHELRKQYGSVMEF